MKALTVYQPWATLIVAGAKPYEFRGWKAPSSIVGKRIVIHAAKRPMVLGELTDLLGRLLNPDEAPATCIRPDIGIPILQEAIKSGLPMSAGLGTAIVGESRIGWDIAEEFGVPRANDSDRDLHANWGWPMLKIERWATPIPARGAQGFWNWKEPEDLGL